MFDPQRPLLLFQFQNSQRAGRSDIHDDQANRVFIKCSIQKIGGVRTITIEMTSIQGSDSSWVGRKPLRRLGGMSDALSIAADLGFSVAPPPSQVNFLLCDLTHIRLKYMLNL